MPETVVADRPESGGPVVRLHSFKVPVRTQSDFLGEFDALLATMRGARGFLGEETFLGGRNPRHVVLLSAWASKRACESFFETAAAPAPRRRLLFKYLEESEFFRSREPAAFAALSGVGARRARSL
jgi:heme-degrading monooxygenase HmoA